MGTKVWASPQWKGAATAWLDEQLSSRGVRRTSAVTQPHLQPWATILTATTTQGAVWLKATGPANAFEVPLYALLHRAVPGRVLAPIAGDVGRGWILLPDGGPSLGDRLDGVDLAAALAVVLRCYAQLQRDFVPEMDAALALGVADMRAQVMPTRFDEALETVGRLIGDAGARATTRHSARSRPYARPTDRGASAWPRLRARRVWITTTFTPGTCSCRASTDQTRSGCTTGEMPSSRIHSRACSSLWAGRRTGLRPPSTRQSCFGFAMATWSRSATSHRTRSWLPPSRPACRVGKVARALTWARAIAQSDPDQLDDDYANAPLVSMLLLLDPSYLGGA